MKQNRHTRVRSVHRIGGRSSAFFRLLSSSENFPCSATGFRPFHVDKSAEQAAKVLISAWKSRRSEVVLRKIEVCAGEKSISNVEMRFLLASVFFSLPLAIHV